MTRHAAAVLERPAALSSLASGSMGKTEQKRSDPAVAGDQSEGEGADKAFDLWLKRGLHQLYDTVAKEPIPESLLRLIEEDRARKG
jgi:hypothetical protein